LFAAASPLIAKWRKGFSYCARAGVGHVFGGGQEDFDESVDNPFMLLSTLVGKMQDKRRRKIEPVAARLPGLLAKTARRKGFAEADVLTAWRKICPEYAGFSYPEKLWKGTLTVVVNSDSARNDLTYWVPNLIERVNVFYGVPVVEKVRFVTKNFEFSRRTREYTPQRDTAARKKAAGMCKNVQDDALREALTNLGSWILKKETT
jgi:hypothetical protein